MMVLSCSASRLVKVMTSRDMTLSKPLVGSSRKIRLGMWMISTPIDRRFNWPGSRIIKAYA
jgi:hypothetical protein